MTHFTGEFYQSVKRKKNYMTSFKLFQKTEEEKTYLKSFYKASVTQIPYPGKTLKKRKPQTNIPQKHKLKYP